MYLPLTLRGYNSHIKGLHSRLLCPGGGDPEVTPLTPNLLLHQRNAADPVGKVEERDMFGRKRWSQVQSLAQAFWKRWRSGYLENLQERKTWIKERSNIREGEVVIVRDRECGRAQ